MRLSWSLLCLFITASVTAELPTIPATAIAVKKELLLSDDFERSEFGEKWHAVVPTFTLENGALKGTQTRITTPATADKPAIVGHAAVIGSNTPTKDSIIEIKFRFEGATTLSVEFDDRAYKQSHYGHICRILITQQQITLRDERVGSMRLDVREMRIDPS
jgi:hypothetical protein